MLPIIRDVHFEESPERLKVVLPVQRSWPRFILFSIMTVLWFVGLIWGIFFLIRDVAFSGERYAFVFSIMLLIWLYIWYRLGKIVWKQWQYYAASREIMYINKERLILRRPVSILGITDAFDRKFVSPLFFSEEHDCAGFNYGSQLVYFGNSLDTSSCRLLVGTLNERYFYTIDDDEDDY